jgi:hypothetical protein
MSAERFVMRSIRLALFGRRHFVPSGRAPNWPGRVRTTCHTTFGSYCYFSALCYHRRMTPHDQQRFGRITLVGLIIAIFGVAFMFGGHPVISALLLLLAWVLVVLDEDIRSG